MKFPPLDLLLDILLNDFLTPALFAGALLYLARGRRSGAVGAVLGLLCGLAIGIWFNVQQMTKDLVGGKPPSSDWLRGNLPFWPESLGWHWLFGMTLAALVVGLVMRIPGWPERLGWVVLATTTLAACLLVASFVQQWGLWIVHGFAFVAAGEWVITEEQARRQPGGLVPFWLAGVFLAGAIVLIHAHCNRFFDLALIFCSTLGALGVVAWLCRLDVGSVVPGAVVALCCLLLAGFSETSSEVPAICFFLVALAPLLLGVTLLPPLTRMSALYRGLLQTALLLLPLVIAVILCMQYESLPDG